VDLIDKSEQFKVVLGFSLCHTRVLLVREQNVELDVAVWHHLV
jgi:hypothetical protein